MLPISDEELITVNDDFRREVIFSISDIIENYGAGIFDENLLPFKKELIRFAFLFEIATNSSQEETEVFSLGALLLANFQPDVGPKPIFPEEQRSEFRKSLFQQAENMSVDELLKLPDNPYIKLMRTGSKERMEIRESIEIAKKLNINLHSKPKLFFKNFIRKVYNVLRYFLIGMILLFCIPFLILPREQRMKILGGAPSTWINALGEMPDPQRSLQWPTIGTLL